MVLYLSFILAFRVARDILSVEQMEHYRPVSLPPFPFFPFPLLAETPALNFFFFISGEFLSLRLIIRLSAP